jgi:hypothetical protein
MFFFFIFFVLIITNALKNKNYIYYKEYAAIVNFFPNLKLHDIIVIYPLKKSNSISNSVNNIITIDFSPSIENNENMIFNLLIGNNVPANIRIKSLSSWNLENWYNTPSLPIHEIPDYKLRQNILSIQNKWKKYYKKGNRMNLYNHNCKHFSNFVIQYLSCLDTFQYKKLAN